MSYHRADYIADLGRAIRHADPSYLAEWNYAIRSLRTTWRCRLGWHWSEFDVQLGRSWSEPGEPGYACSWCGKEVLPVRLRLLDWLHTKTPLGDLRERWFFWWHPYGIKDNREWCLRHDKPWGEE